MQIVPMVIDLSHWDSASDYAAVKAAGIVGVIYKATEGASYTDETYVSQQSAAKTAALLWGGFHFADASSVNAQIDNFMRFCCPDPDELFCLDWEDNDGNCMSAADAKTWIEEVEKQLSRPGECVIYSGNTAKEKISGRDAFLGSRRLWLCQYTTGTPTWQESWDSYWLYQFTDGQYGPSPHAIDGVGACDISSYDQDGGAMQLAAEWATGKAGPSPVPPPPVSNVVNVLITAPAGVEVRVRQSSGTAPLRQRSVQKAARHKEGGALTQKGER
jgi:lysozyme